MITLADQTLWMLTMLVYVVSCLAIVILWIRLRKQSLSLFLHGVHDVLAQRRCPGSWLPGTPSRALRLVAETCAAALGTDKVRDWCSRKGASKHK